MTSSASHWSANRLLIGLALLTFAGCLLANNAKLVSSQPVDINAAEYSPADAQGRFTYLIEFVEPSLIERHSQRSSARFDYSSPANLTARDQLMAIQAERVLGINQAIGREAQASHHYLASRNGIAMRLTPSEAERVASMAGVSALQRERLYDISTYRGPEFIGASAIWDGSAVPGGTPYLGELMIAAILDSGIPDPTVHPSFVNDASCGHGAGGVPDKVISFLDCSTTDGSGLCNGPDPIDENGHGSHTASTVAGNFVDNTASPSPEVPAPFDGISGVAPCAHIRSYDVCSVNGGQSCGGADIAGGLESVLIQNSAPEGPISVMNYSISGGSSPWADFDRDKLDIVDAGVFVAASAGNTGADPDPVGRVNHRGPWVMSVAASTHDGQIRDGIVDVTGGPSGLAAVEGTGPTLNSVFNGTIRAAVDVDASNVEGCSAFPANAFDGEVALIARGTCPFTDKVNNAVAAGANFVLVYTDARAVTSMGGLASTTVSSFMIENADGLAIEAFLAGSTAPVTIDPTPVGAIDPNVGDVLASFSLRGPTPSPLQDLQKPNITGPGVNILAAVPGGYAFLSGTSMSSPHVAGAGLLVRQANPGWTVSEVKSAMQMTAFNGGTKEDGTTPWDADDVGHGRIDLTKAALAGLVMDETTAAYLAADPSAGGDVKTLNTPDVRNLNCIPSCSFQRTVRNTLGVASNWTVTADSGNANLDIQVSPSSFSFTGDTSETVTLTIDFTPQANLTAAIEFGQILLTEDAAQAPDARITTAISGTNFLPAEAQVDATELEILLEEGGSGSQTFNISNVAEAGLSEDLTYSIEEATPAVVLGGDRGGPSQPIDLILDGGIATIINGGDQQWLWMNQFTPGPLDVPFTLEEVDIAFAPGNGGVQAGDSFDVYVWTDPDRDPTTGADFMTSVTGQTITTGVNFQTVLLPGGGVPISPDSGDVLIGVVNRTSAATYAVAVADSPGNSQQRSWAGLGFPGGVAGSPPEFDQPGFFGLIDEQVAGRNWTIRGFGTGGSGCLAPSDVPWLTVTPALGTVAPGSSEQIQVDVDMTGLGQGTFEARVCISTSDPENANFVLPLTVVVTGVGGLPTIDVAPASVGVAVDVLNTTGSGSIDISNTGNDLALEWSIDEAEGAPSPGVCDSPSDVPWMSVTPTSGTTAGGGTSPAALDFDAAGLAPGLYDATLCVRSNDPATPLVEVPVTMEVTVPANAARIEGTVQGLGHCQANPILAAGAGVEIVGGLETFNLTADASGFFSLYLDAANGPVDITASAPNHLPGTLVDVAIAGESTTLADFGLVLQIPCAQIVPGSYSEVLAPGDTGGNFAMTILNELGGAQLVWGVQEADSTATNDYVYGLPEAGELLSTTGSARGGEAVSAERAVDQSPLVDAGIQGAPIDTNFTEAFDDVTLLPGAGWALQNLSDPLGTTDWFQGNDVVFPAHQGAATAYIGANYNSTAGVGTISNWLMTPEVELRNGTEMRFWTRRSTSSFPDRLEVRLSDNGSSTFAGAGANDVGDFDVLLLSINENLVPGEYPQVWTEFVVEVSGLPEPTSGRFAFRYFVTNAGPSGANSDYIGIDTVSVTPPDYCSSPGEVPWLSVDPFFGVTELDESSVVNIGVDASGLAPGNYEAFICVSSNDEQTGTIQVPFSLEVLGDLIFQDRFEATVN